MLKKKDYFDDLIKLLPMARAPFSNVSVAAIIVTDKGIFKGVNFEDPVLNLGICAERSAIFSGITAGMQKIYEIHILANIPQRKKLNMCGACRQVASLFADENAKVCVYSLDKSKEIVSFKKLFPRSNLSINKNIIKG